MFDIGALELFLIVIITLVVVGPRRLPEVAQMIGSTIAKVRRFVANVKQETNLEKHIVDFKNQAGMIEDGTVSQKLKEELRSVHQEIDSLKETAKESSSIITDPLLSNDKEAISKK